jgi:HK97 family phage major capsid protein
MNIEKLKRQRADKIDAMRQMLDTIEARETRGMTPEERGEYEAMEAAVTSLDDQIGKEERLQELESRTAAPAVILNRTPDSESGFRDFGDFLREVRTNPGSSRLQERATTMGNKESIGYVVPEEYDSTIRAVSPSDAIVRPRAYIVPTSESNPDAPTHLVALDQGGDKGVYSGVKVSWVGETDDRQNAGDPSVRQITVTPNEVSAYIDVSNKLLNNSNQAADLVQRLLRQSIIAAEEVAFITGDGINKPLGFVGHESNVKVNRQTASTITYKDIIEMDAVSVGGLGGDYVFIASRSAKPSLRSLKDEAGNLIWQENARVGEPGTLMGIPVFFSERLPAVGTSGDIVLANLQSYAIKDGSPLAIIVDPYTQLVKGMSRIYAFWNVDGQPLLNSSIKGEDAINRSSFVTLS